MNVAANMQSVFEFADTNFFSLKAISPFQTNLFSVRRLKKASLFFGNTQFLSMHLLFFDYFYLWYFHCANPFQKQFVRTLQHCFAYFISFFEDSLFSP